MSNIKIFTFGMITTIFFNLFAIAMCLVWDIYWLTPYLENSIITLFIAGFVSAALYLIYEMIKSS